MFIWEEPIEAIRNMAPYAISTHFKDHTVSIMARRASPSTLSIIRILK